MNYEDESLAVQRLPVLARIPRHRIALLFLSGAEPRSHAYGMQLNITVSASGKVTRKTEELDDPSTIYARLPLREPNSDDSVPSLPYFPSYSGMKPEQRAFYLRWLCDTSRQTEIGYVFVYYYGLERQLVFGDFDAAVDEIIDLRKYHSNKSFQAYSASALVHACLIRKRLDKFQDLYSSRGLEYFGNSNLLILHHGGLDLSTEVLLQLAECMYGVNRRYLRAYPDLYRQVVIETLQKCFGKDSYPFATRFSLENVEEVRYPIFANISLSDKIRTPALPNLLLHTPFQEELGGFFREIHETVKLLRKSALRKIITSSTPT